MKAFFKSIAIVSCIFVAATSANAQFYHYNGTCTQGAVKAQISGLPSSNSLVSATPSCLVTVYITGTQNLATLYSTQGGTVLSNPFTAQSNALYSFYTTTGYYDIQNSGTGMQTTTLSNVGIGPVGGGGGSGEVIASPQFQKTYFPTAGTVASVQGDTGATTDGAGNELDQSLNHVFQANAPGIAGINSTITTAGTTGSVVIPLSQPVLVAGPTWSVNTITATGGSLGTGTYTYMACQVIGGVEQRCTTSAPITVSSGVTNVINLKFTFTGATYNIYGRVAGSIGFLKTITSGSQAFDNGSLTPGAAYQGNFSNPNGIGIDDLRLGPLSHFAAGLPVVPFGCAADGVTDDRVCLQSAINYAEGHGKPRIMLTPGKTYAVTSTGGTVNTAGDNGTCPSGATVNGAACTTIAPLYATQAYSLIVHGGNLDFDLNGATLLGPYPYTLFNAASPSQPAMIACADSSGNCTNFILDGGGNGSITDAFIDVLVPGVFSFSYIHDINFTTSGIPFLSRIWDSSHKQNINMTTETGFLVGGWYYDRANTGSTGLNIEDGGYADGYQSSNERLSEIGSFLANHANTDNYFYTYIYQGQNQGNGRMVDVPGTSSPNGPNSINTLIPYRGVYGQGNALMGRYGRPDNGISIVNFQSKFMSRSAVLTNGTMQGADINIVGAEADALCDDGVHYVGDPVNCPDPWGPGTINPGFINPASILNSRINSISAPAGYLSSVANPNGSVTMTNNPAAPGQTSPPNRIVVHGGQNFTTSTGSVSGTLDWDDVQLVSPGNLASGATVDWIGKVIQNGTTIFGGLLDFNFNYAGSNYIQNFAVRVPYLALGSNPAGTCDAPATGYTGHAGWINYIAGGSGVADTAEICTKDASNTYAWRSILGGGGGSGTVTSVAQTVPSWLSVSGSPITSTGTLAITAATGQTSNQFLATPNGSTGAVGLRALVPADVPTLNQNTTGTAANLSGTPALPFGTSATTATVGDNTTKLATDAFVLANTGISGLTVNTIPKAASATSIGNSAISDNGTTVTSTEPMSAPSISIGGSQALTSVQGTAGTKLAATSGTFTNGNLRSTNATGDAVDSNIAANNILVLNGINTVTGEANFVSGVDSVLITGGAIVGKNVGATEWSLDSVTGAATLNVLTVYNAIGNQPGLQIASGAGCTITAGAIGGTCTGTVTLPSVEPDTAYNITGCSILNPTAGPSTIGGISALSTTAFTFTEVALGTASTGGGTVKCMVTHN